MRAAQEIILGGIDESKCLECRDGYEKAKIKPPCVEKNKCIYTGEPKVRLNYAERMMMDETMDFLATGMIISNNFERRQSILRLASYIKNLIQQKDKVCQPVTK